MHMQVASELQRTRNQTVARSFYRQLKTEGFSSEEIIELSTNLLDLVTQELRTPDQSQGRS